MEDANPYAAPKAAEISADEGPDAWHVMGIGVMVRNGTVLPPIELETGDDGAGLILSKRKFVKPNWTANLGAFIYPVIIMSPESWWTWANVPPWLPMVIAIIATTALMIVISKVTVRPIHFHVYRNAKTERTEKRRDLIRRTLIGLSSLFFLAAMVMLVAMDDFSAWAYGCLIAGVLQVFGTSIWKYMDRPQVHMAAADNNWVRLAGVHQTAIRKLRESRGPEKKKGRTFLSDPW